MKTDRRLYFLVLGIVMVSVGLTGTIISKVHREATKEKAAELFDVLIENVESPFQKGTNEHDEWKEFQKSTRVDLISAETNKTNSISSMILAAGIGLTFSMGGALLVKRKRSDNQAAHTTPAIAPR